MFEGFANVWTPVVSTRELGTKPVGTKIAGEPIVLFRDKKGGVGALIDRCPHRGVALSLGEVNEDGCLSCPFHGWAFRTDGACAHVPLNPIAVEKRARYAATALPVREIGGLVWVFTGADAAGTEPEPAPALVEPGWHISFFAEMWSAHWTRAMENMLDTPHLPFVHRRSIGRKMRAKLRPDSVLECSIEPTTWGAEIRASFDGASTGAGLAWRRPNGMELRIIENKWHGQIFCVPVDADHTRMVFGFARKFLGNRVFSWISDRMNRRIAGEDRAVVESSMPREVPPPAEELSVATDAPTLYFRRYYYRELRGSSTTLVPASRLAARRSPQEESMTAE
jgi:phenylpropionate dioxygenase-like ring-hydroxylating dioxygenase large terminal subunit